MHQSSVRNWCNASGTCLLTLALLGAIGLSNARAGVLVQVPEQLQMPSVLPAPIHAAPTQTPAMQASPVQVQPFRRIDDQDSVIAAEIESLAQLANAPNRQGGHKSKVRPRASSGSLAPGNAAWTLGLIYQHGAGVAQDLPRAQTWFEQAVQMGARQALAGVAWCAIEGCRNPPAPAQASQWIDPLMSVSRPRAQYLQWLANERLAPLRTATSELQSMDIEPVAPPSKLLLASARGGDLHALIELGLIAVANGQTDQALKYFQEAAPKSAVASVNASIVVDSMQAPSPKQPEGNKIAAELFADAQRFHRGEGRPVNYVEAIRLYRLAADKGSAEAKRMLALIYSRPLIKGSFDVQWISQLGELDLGQSMPGLRIKTAPRQLQRERTALVDLLPAKWRARIF